MRTPIPSEGTGPAVHPATGRTGISSSMGFSVLMGCVVAHPAYRTERTAHQSVRVIHAATVPAARAAFHVRQERP